MSKPVRVGEMLVDLEAILRLKHHCDPKLCKDTISCCRCYEVCVTRKEMSRVVGLMPAARGYARRLKKPGFENPFDKVEPGLWAIDTHEDESCVFAYRKRTRETYCALHSAALDLGLDPYAMKPSPCTLWPLALSEDKPPLLSVQSDIARFPCIRRRGKDVKRLYPAVAAHIAQAFGKVFLKDLEAAIEQRNRGV